MNLALKEATPMQKVKSDEVSGEFWKRHIGPSEKDQKEMLSALGCKDINDLLSSTIPGDIRLKNPFRLTEFETPLSEEQALSAIREHANKNTCSRSFIGMGYYGTHTPKVILRNILENPGWYTQYTPYQPEISQGRLEALLNYQTCVTELTGLPIANASLLDEATAAAEAMTMSYGIVAKKKKEASSFFVSSACHPQTIDVLRTRASVLGIEVEVGEWRSFKPNEKHFGVLLQYPDTTGEVSDYSSFIATCHDRQVLVTVAADLLALVLLKDPASMGADIAVGSSQRFGVPMGYGGPHAAYFATREDYKRVLPGRLVGVSKDTSGNRALRLALQTREQHIRREKATSNICTAQVLLAILAGMYALYHGKSGLIDIAKSVHQKASALAKALKNLGIKVVTDKFFDTFVVELAPEKCTELFFRAHAEKIHLRKLSDTRVGISVDEVTTEKDISDLVALFGGTPEGVPEAVAKGEFLSDEILRGENVLNHPIFSSFQSETEMLRYIKTLESKDLSLCSSMIPLGSCTMKLNATSEMIPVTWPEFSSLHPFAPASDAQGYSELFDQLERALAEITGFDSVSLQPNAGSQGEYAGLLAIKRYLEASGQASRKACLIPLSAHGTNPASAIMAGMTVVPVKCDSDGNIDHEDLKAKCEEHSNDLAALMITYPSTHGVFEEGIREVCDLVHKHGGQVYLDGANLNAMVGLARPADFGADVCHMNLHKTFCIPHGGGGPGVGPIGVKAHLTPYLPGHVVHLEECPSEKSKPTGAVSAAPWGSSSILPIPWMYIALMGSQGLKRASEVAILNANYIARKLEGAYPVLFKGGKGFVAHECILDFRPFKQSAGIEVVDVAKRLMDYGFHAPTISWPVPGTMMIEPTESEPLSELDRFVEAMLSIREEIKKIENGQWPQESNPLKNAPHTAQAVTADSWDRPYTRQEAAYPSNFVKSYKFWPAVGRLDESYGDRNLVCSCPTMDEY